MASTDKKIRMTIELDNADYNAFHQKVESQCANHSKIVRRLIKAWTAGTCSCPENGVNRRRA